MPNLRDDFENIYKLHFKALLIASQNIVRDGEAAHDIVQEVFVKLWHRSDELTAILQIKAYLYKAVINSSLTYLEKNKKNVRIANLQFEAEGSTDKDLLNKELLLHIQHALEKLPPKCKAIFVLSRFEEMKNKEIAEALGLSLKTVENQMGIALKKMKEELKTYLKNDLLIFLTLFGLASLPY